MKMKKIFTSEKKLVLILLLSIMVAGTCLQAQAASVKKLTKNSTYRTTLTGKETHTLRYTNPDGQVNHNKMYLYIDGKKVRTLDYGAHGWEVSLVKVASGRTLICAKDYDENDYNNCFKVYEYKNARLYQLADLCSLTRNAGQTGTKLLSAWSRCGGIKVTGKNQISLEWVDTAASTGIFYINVSYRITDSRISRVGTYYSLKKGSQYTKLNWTAARSFTAYTTAGGTRKSFTVSAGQKVTGLKMTRKNGTVYFKIKNSSGKTGWFKNASTYAAGAYFKEAQFAG